MTAHPAELPGAPRPACRGAEHPDLWFPASEHRDRVQAQVAIRICQRCPLVNACRDWATEHRVVGIWGATNTEEREATRSRRPAHGGRAATGRVLAPCPSEAAYRRHLYHGERCRDCLAHQGVLKRARRARRTAELATAGAA